MRNQIVVLGTVSWLMFAGMVHAAEIKVLSTQATEEAYRELVPQFEKASGHKVTTIFTGTLDANRRLAAGETYDLLIMSAPSIDEQIKAGRVVPGSRVDLAKSGVGVGVKAGAPKPDFSSAEALKKTLIAAKTVGYSQGPSGVYLLTLFEKMGIADQVKAKAKVVTPGVPVATVIRSGEAEIGFQQISELIHEKGIDYLGPLPADIQRITTFSGGIHTAAKEQAAAKALQSFLTSPDRVQDLKKHGLQPG